MELRPGLRLASAVCATEVVVVKGQGDDVDLRCGGSPMAAAGSGGGGGSVDPDHADGSLLGKRYTDAGETVEVLCAKPGEGSLSIGDEPLAVKGTKPLPASD